MKKEENLMLHILSEEDVYKHDCKFANSGTGHTIYCDNRDENAPRKCTYRMDEQNMCNCALFSAKINKQNLKYQ